MSSFTSSVLKNSLKFISNYKNTSLLRSFSTISVKHPYYKDVSTSDWNDWKWQIKNRIQDPLELQKILKIDDDEINGVFKVLNRFRMAITPYYLSLMDSKNPICPIKLQSIPRIHETYIKDTDMEDPLHEDVDSPVPLITHRYPDRVLFLVTDQCTMYCRHCTRRRMAGQNDKISPKDDIEKAIDYIRGNPVVRDVVISGGDPLTLNTDVLEDIIKKIRSIDHVEIIRIGTRTPVVCPQRITDELCNMLKKYHPLYVNTHFNHPKEMTPESQLACKKLADAGISLGNQSVLLKGVNDDADIMKALVHELLKNRVRPYYIYQCDMAMGIEHFRTSIGKGIEIIEMLRGHTTGFGVPTFVVDAPGGGGKIPVMPQYLISRTQNKAFLRNFEGVITTYTEPDDASFPSPITEEEKSKYCLKRKKNWTGLAKLINEEQTSLEPSCHKRGGNNKID